LVENYIALCLHKQKCLSGVEFVDFSYFCDFLYKYCYVDSRIAYIFLPLSPNSVRKGIMFSGCQSAAFVRPSVRSSRQILLPRYLMNALNNFDKTDREYSLPSTDDLTRFCRSKVNVTAGRRGGKGILVDVGRSNPSSSSSSYNPDICL